MKRDEFLGLFLAQLEIKDLITDKKKRKREKKSRVIDAEEERERVKC